MTYRPLFLVILLITLLSACATPAAPAPTTVPTVAPVAPAPTAGTNEATSAPASAATNPPAPASEAAIISGIQRALDLYDQAQESGDPATLAQAVDQENLPFRRLVQARVERRVGTTSNWQVKRIKQREQGFVEAHLENGASGADWTFRQLPDGRWVLSEPQQGQVGKRTTTEGEHFTFQTYPWTAELNPQIEQLMNEARQIVYDKLGNVPTLAKKPIVRIVPIISTGALESANALAYYDRSSRAGDTMFIFAPGSYAFGGYSLAKGWQAELRETLAHEYTHLVQNRAFIPIARLNDWMVEGLAEYISAPDAGYTRGVPAAVRADRIIPIIDPAPAGSVDRNDLEHLTILPDPNDVSLGYGLATTLVEFTVEKYGGLDGFWKMARAYDKTQKFDTALQQAFGVDYVTFDAQWRAWLKQKYS